MKSLDRGILAGQRAPGGSRSPSHVQTGAVAGRALDAQGQRRLFFKPYASNSVNMLTVISRSMDSWHLVFRTVHMPRGQ
jgi:hypothetical protein